MLRVRDLLRSEGSLLALYAMRCADSRGRAHPEEPHPYRTDFQRDRDRIVHSRAFRRLEYKTQVFVNHEGDYYRTRLTHTLEAAQIARTSARVLRLNEDLVEAVALAHDLGHPPFGHSGEAALQALMAEHGGFEHNRQSLRILDVLEKKHPAYDGLNLTYEMRESIVKHTDGAPCDPEFEPGLQPLLEAQLVDVCDSIAYSSHDLDDGFKAGLIRLDDARDVRLIREAFDAAKSGHGSAGLCERTLALQVVRTLIDRQVSDLLDETERRLRDARVDSVDAVRRQTARLVAFSDGLSEERRELDAFLGRLVYREPRVMRMARKARRFIEALFAEYVSYPEQLPFEFQKLAERDGVPRAACDYIAGMTDRYAQAQYQNLFAPFEKTLQE